MNRAEFYQNHLDQVSRSFSFCIAQLKTPLKDWISLSYLLFRVLDTIEDAPWSDQKAKEKMFKDFEFCLLAPEPLSLPPDWAWNLPHETKLVEKNLLRDLPIFLNHLCDFPESVQTNLKNSIFMMSQGMQHFSKSSQIQKEFRLINLVEVNQYCFFVAGLVGELLTNFISNVIPHFELKHDLYVRSHQFGLFLQKINLLKDQSQDEKEGRYLVPDRQELMMSLKQDATGAIEYLTQIPISQKEYRLFCAWSLFLGLSTLPWIESSWLKKIFEKIPREMTQVLLSRVEKIIDDNIALIQFFNDSLSFLKSSSNSIQINSKEYLHTQWLTEIYNGQLNLNDLKQLGVIGYTNQSF